MSEENESLGLEDLRKICSRRAEFHRFLSRAFKKEVDVAFLYISAAFQPTVTFLTSWQRKGELADGARLLEMATSEIKAATTKQQRETLLNTLAAEYASMFLGVGLKPVYITESANSTPEHVNYQRPYFEVKDAYKSLGFEKPNDFLEPEDHIAMELDFMGQLCGWTKECLETSNFEYASRYLKLQKEFLDDHLSKWHLKVCEGMRRATSSTFYVALANLTSGFLALEGELILFLEAQLETLSKTVTKKVAESEQTQG
jgi:putative dimethyl sulfoxide reductase chaperone